MTPTKVGIIGLSTVTKHTVGAWGVVAHLRSLNALPDDYQIVAVANSTAESAQKSIDFHKLPAGTRAYGSPEEMANDPEVDLVVVSVRVGKHMELARPALENKKSVFVEWPLGASPAESKEMAQLAAANNVKTMVGLQGRHDPILYKIRGLILSGKIGSVVSTTVALSFHEFPPDHWIKGAEYALDFKTGGSLFTVVLGHVLDSLMHVLGDFADVQAILKNSRPTIPIIDLANGQVIDPAYPKTSPDQVFIQGTLKSGAIMSLVLKQPKATFAEVSHRWTITGTDGEIELIHPHAGQFANGTVRIKTRENVEQIAVSEDEADEKVADPGKNTFRLYQKLAKGDESVADFESGSKVHDLLDRIAASAGWDL